MSERVGLTTLVEQLCCDLVLPEGEFVAFDSLLLIRCLHRNSVYPFLDDVSRLDDFLFTLEGDRYSGPLARACREDLALLTILADWCEDHDRPVAAAEARHLWSLVVSILRE